MATGLSIGIGGVYISRLDVKVKPELIGEMIECVYDNLINETVIDSLTIEEQGELIGYYTLLYYHHYNIYRLSRN